MTELSGMLDGLGLSAIVRFLSGLHKTGCLRLVQDDWSGEVCFAAGTLTHASLGTRTGLSALDGLIEVFPSASFAFDSSAPVPAERTVQLDRDRLLEHLDEVAARVARGERKLPAANAVPSQVTSDGEAEEPVQVDRASLQTLMLVDGRRSVREIVARRGSFDALWHLGRLLEAGLIELGAQAAPSVSAASAAAATPPAASTPAAPPPPAARTSAAATPPVPSAPATATPPAPSAPAASAPAAATPPPMSAPATSAPAAATPPAASAPVPSAPAAATPPPMNAPATSAPAAATPPPMSAPATSAPAAATPPPMSAPAAPDPASDAAATVVMPAPRAPEPAPTPMPRPAEPEAPTPVFASREDPVARATAHCPKLGFEDDPSSSFGRPTRLHRCFAAGKPLPLSLDQQRELCLSDQYPTCPRLLSATSSSSPSSRPAPRPESAPDDQPRIVRLPLIGRPTSPERDLPSGSSAAPIPLREITPAAPEAGGASSPTLAGPRPLRARMSRTPGASAASAAQVLPEPVAPARPRPEPSRLTEAAEVAEPPFTVVDAPRERHFGPIPFRLIPAFGLVVVAVGVIVYLLLPQSDSLFGDNAVDPALLPNASLLAAGTPVADLPLNRATPVPAQATLAAAQDAQPGAADANATAAPVASKPAAARPQASAAPVQQPTSVTNVSLFDERFATNDAGWPSNPAGAALITNGTYRIATRQAGQFAAVGAPVASIPSDVVVSASFRKLAGPPGGGYGIIVRDQADVVRDGTSQDGRYYVLEAGDKGEVGIWRRDGDHWVDLLPWQHSDAVKTDTATNELVVRAIGNTLSLSVNGTPVATRTDDAFTSGRVGLFVGGDGNQVAVTRFAIQTP